MRALSFESESEKLVKKRGLFPSPSGKKKSAPGVADSTGGHWEKERGQTVDSRNDEEEHLAFRHLSYCARTIVS
jgi:hypothetical protein